MQAAWRLETDSVQSEGIKEYGGGWNNEAQHQEHTFAKEMTIVLGMMRLQEEGNRVGSPRGRREE